jgi:hypothetical protein
MRGKLFFLNRTTMALINIVYWCLATALSLPAQSDRQLDNRKFGLYKLPRKTNVDLPLDRGVVRVM